LEDAEAWWQAYDAIQMVDHELRRTDVLLADARGDDARFSIQRVANAEAPRLLAKDVEAVGWIPVDTKLKVNQIPDLINKLGGEALYGKDDFVPVRELLQNAVDAVRLRGVIVAAEDSSLVGLVKVRLQTENGRKFLEVQDNGIGMDENAILNHLLAFGSSGWLDTNLSLDFPNIDFQQVCLTGKFGIGFFSVFMIADQVEISTRRYNASLDDGLILTFGNGISGRPVLRKPTRSERLLDGGTKVRLWLKSDVFLEGFGPEQRGAPMSLYGQCYRIFCLTDVTMEVHEYSTVTRIERTDWRPLTGEDISTKLYTSDDLFREASKWAPNLRDLVCDGVVIGKLALVAYGEALASDGKATAAMVASGVIVSYFGGMIGAVECRIQRAARDLGMVDFSPKGLAAWASNQATLLAGMSLSTQAQLEVAAKIRALGGDTATLMIAECSEGPLNKESLHNYLRSLAHLIHPAEVRSAL
jgi:hypothetical protein